MTNDQQPSWEQIFSGSQLVVGVPDSLLANFIKTIPRGAKHVSAPNEGSAIAIAAGYALGSNTVPIVYMQNSGLGNAINPLLSLAHKEIYGCPMLLVVGWRGEVSDYGFQRDEPQHNPTGRVTKDLLQLISTDLIVVDKEQPLSPVLVNRALKKAKAQNSPQAILVKASGVQEVVTGTKDEPQNATRLPSRREYLELISEFPDVHFIATTGHIAREMREVCEQKDMPDRVFMVTGAMGHVISVATGFALAKPQKRFVILDGDGSFQMHMGSGSLLSKTDNLSYVVLNNGAHASVGGQPTCSPDLDLSKILSAFTGHGVRRVDTLEDLAEATRVFPFFVECKTNLAVRKDLKRPDLSHKEMALNFLASLEERGNK